MQEKGEMIHSFLLIRQSNAAGRGISSEVEAINNDRIFVLRNGIWRPMYVPVNADRKTSGICFAESFADLYSKEKNVDVGIIPCADGGSSFDRWAVGGLLFDHALYMAELAARTSTIAGVLWHQGESDCGEDLYPLYEEKLTVILNAFREKLKLYDVPFLLGGLGDFLADCSRKPEFKNYIHINDSLIKMAERDNLIGFVSAEGLTPNSDNLHFSSTSLRKFGIRYFKEFLKLENNNKVFTEKAAYGDVAKTDLDLL